MSLQKFSVIPESAQRLSGTQSGVRSWVPVFAFGETGMTFRLSHASCLLSFTTRSQRSLSHA